MKRRTFIKGSMALAAVSFLCPAAVFSTAAQCRAAKSQPWWQKTIVYQIYPKSFADTTGDGTGDLNGIIRHLDYLQDLGVGAIWLTPIYPSPMVDNGYDISDYCAIDPTYGSMEDFHRLIAEGEKRGIRIVMDLVFNHSSDQHAWFLASKKDRVNPKADWYIWRDAKPDGSAPTNWRSIFGGSAWEWSEERRQYYLHTFAPQQPDLNWETPAVREALFAAANFWLDKGVGGFRVDAITYIKKPKVFADGTPDGKDGLSGIHAMTANTDGILSFLHEFKQKVFAGRDIFTVGEANGVSAGDLHKWVGQEGVFDMLFEFSHMNLPLKNGEVWCHPTKWSLTELKQALTNSQNVTKNDGWCPVFFENHDQPRCVNHFFPREADPEKAAKAMAAILLTMRGTPFIYEGQELGCTNVSRASIDDYNDISSHGQYEFALEEGFTPEEALEFVHYFSRDNARTPMPWSSGRHAGFTSGTPWLPLNENYTEINVKIEENEPDSVLAWYKVLTEFRRRHEELLSGAYQLLLPDSEEIFAFERSLKDSRIITAVNFSLKKAALPPSLQTKSILLDSEPDSSRDISVLMPLEARIYQG